MLGTTQQLLEIHIVPPTSLLVKLSLNLWLFYFVEVITPEVTSTCKDLEFECSVNECINVRLVCNGYIDCRNEADEDDCSSINGKIDRYLEQFIFQIQ